MLNDDSTPFDFVVAILVSIFGKKADMAADIALHIHSTGSCVILVCPKNIAETKVRQVAESASSAGFPLRCIVRSDD